VPSLQSAAVAGERVKLEVRARESRGSADARRLRKQGLIPGVLYGQGKEPSAVCIPERELRRVFTGAGGLNAILDVVIEGDGGSPLPSVLKEYQQDPLRGTLTHVDLQEVRLDQPIQTQVPVTLVGESAGSKEGGVLSQVTRELNVEALPMEVPESLELDVSELHIGDALRLADLPPPKGVTFLDDLEETVIATITTASPVEEPGDELEQETELVGEDAAQAQGATGDEAASAQAGGDAEAPAG
jgi:large subunit ribosomal protein L25